MTYVMVLDFPSLVAIAHLVLKILYILPQRENISSRNVSHGERRSRRCGMKWAKRGTRRQAESEQGKEERALATGSGVGRDQATLPQGNIRRTNDMLGQSGLPASYEGRDG